MHLPSQINSPSRLLLVGSLDPIHHIIYGYLGLRESLRVVLEPLRPHLNRPRHQELLLGYGCAEYGGNGWDKLSVM